MNTTHITGLILAGGQGNRMGGSDKGLILFEGKPLFLHALARLQPQVGPIMLNANRNQDIYAGFDLPVVADAENPQQEAFAGPLAGLLAGLKACTTDWLVTVPCDSPAFPMDLVSKFIAAATAPSPSPLAGEKMGRGGGLFVACTPVQTHPVFMLAHKNMAATLEAFLNSGERKLGFWQKQNGAVLVEFPDEAAFANLNTPEELSSLEKNT